MRINPIYKTELKIHIRSRRMMILIVCINFLLAIMALSAIYVCFVNQSQSQELTDYSEVLKVYATIVVMIFSLCLLIVPGLTASCISSEREKQTLDLLLTTNASSFDIIMGKFLASISQVVLIIISSLPIVALVFCIGGITILNIMQIFIMLIVTTIYTGSISIFWSAFIKKSMPATVCAYATVLCIIALTLILNGLGLVMTNKMNGVNIVSYLQYKNEISFLPVMYSLLINPMITLVLGLEQQIGGLIDMAGIYGTGKIQNFILLHWYSFSMLVQMLISTILLTISVKLLKKQKS